MMGTVPVVAKPSFWAVSLVSVLSLAAGLAFVCGLGMYAALVTRVFLIGWRVMWW